MYQLFMVNLTLDNKKSAKSFRNWRKSDTFALAFRKALMHS